MSSTVIRIEGLSKQYVLRHQKPERYQALRDVITSSAKSAARRLLHPFRHRTRQSNTSRELFWALKDINLEVRQGDRLGVIGRNGAGKSTLLKILSRITEPSSGRVSIKGRISSLLEVGTGFHPELTGRENIFLNGSILGMRMAEIKRKFDEIVAFAEVEKFLDTPVKHYSSGMYVRLAFSVAAHLEPEILVVDEVLAVGDAQFQKKCLGKMEEVGKEGRTVLFVSHNMNAIEQLCSSAFCLERGRVKIFDKSVRNVIKSYLFDRNTWEETAIWTNKANEFDNPWFHPLSLSVVDCTLAAAVMPIRNDSEVWVRIDAEIREIDPALTVGYAIYSEEGDLLYWSYQTDGAEPRWPKLRYGVITLLGKLPARLLNEGRYRVELIGGLHFRQWLFEPGVNAPSIYVEIQGGLSDSPYWMSKRPGLLAPVVEWTATEPPC